MIFEKPAIYALIAGNFFLGLLMLHYKVSYNGAEKRVIEQAQMVQVWKQSTVNLSKEIETQNRALEVLKSEQALKDAQNATVLLKAQREAEDARTRAKGIAARQKPANVPTCTAAGSLFDEVVHGKN